MGFEDSVADYIVEAVFERLLYLESKISARSTCTGYQ